MILEHTTYDLDLNGTVLQDANKSSILFFDIETTGFSAKSSSLYLIGAITWQKDQWILTQWLAEDAAEESRILKAFLDFAEAYSQLIHFNGDRFDIPYLLEKCAQYQLKDTLSGLISRDLYRMIRPLRTLLQLPALKQKALEEFLGIYREDPYNGGELISVYQHYSGSRDPKDLKKLLLHNLEDLKGMLSVLSILNYQVVIDGSYSVTSCEKADDSLLVFGRLPLFLPKPFSYGNQWFYVIGEQDRIAFKIFAQTTPLKYFFSDYQNYYYLPEEDVAMHKSVAAYVDKSHREPAKASTCYQKRNGFFLPQFTQLYKPVFQTDYHAKQYFFSYGADHFADNQELYHYTQHLISYTLK